MKRLLYTLMVGIAITACSSKDDIEVIQERAGNTALEYYKLLLDEKYEDFVAGIDGGDSLPADYKEQMVANTAMFMQQQKDNHRGIADISITRCTADTAAHTANALLKITYSDSVKEVVCVPLIERNNVWYMK